MLITTYISYYTLYGCPVALKLENEVQEQKTFSIFERFAQRPKPIQQEIDERKFSRQLWEWWNGPVVVDQVLPATENNDNNDDNDENNNNPSHNNSIKQLFKNLFSKSAQESQDVVHFDTIENKEKEPFFNFGVSSLFGRDSQTNQDKNELESEIIPVKQDYFSFFASAETANEVKDGHGL